MARCLNDWAAVKGGVRAAGGDVVSLKKAGGLQRFECILIEATGRRKRVKNHMRLSVDGFRFPIIITRIATLFSPPKISRPLSYILPIAVMEFYYPHAFLIAHRYTFGALLLIHFMLTILIMDLMS